MVRALTSSPLAPPARPAHPASRASLSSLGPVLRRVADARVTELVDGLAAKLESPKPKDGAARELGVLGLKTMVGESAPGARATVQLVARLRQGRAEVDVAWKASDPGAEDRR